MLDPKDQGDFEEWSSLSATLTPFLKGPVRIFLTWSDANAKAISTAAPDLFVELDGIAWSQSVGGPQKYHAKSLGELRRFLGELQRFLGEVWRFNLFSFHKKMIKTNDAMNFCA